MNCHCKVVALDDTAQRHLGRLSTLPRLEVAPITLACRSRQHNNLHWVQTHTHTHTHTHTQTDTHNRAITLYGPVKWPVKTTRSGNSLSFCCTRGHFNHLCDVFIRLEPMLRGEYWNYLRARFGGVYAIGYNSADSEPIWMKFGALWVHCWGLALAHFGRDPRSSDSLRGSRIFVCFLSIE